MKKIYYIYQVSIRIFILKKLYKNVKKCKFHKKKVNFSDFIVKENGIYINLNKIHAIKK